MNLPLPGPVSLYFDIGNGSDIAQITRCFMHDAVVTDEKQTYRGLDAILAWKYEAKKKFEYSVEPLSISRDGDRLTVTANVVGNFPGSPVQLDHVFNLTGDKINSLEIR
ncbi:nuclear transport factor 2 family protein [Enterobacteriaceae bacterium H20N1]|uniref:Nuclear transport factor 2 family protein n=1 Tax=Dryocola boscaweniae TaxID=2925397 RepID=A0A9X2W5J3_9ENTR|nr:nuclear transport factor 2 family protein [Dryocola boscaweniae]MCT4701460.1 nuclear transport factor 2 family protein [Dryocola boscaweniae]MCT4716707.1 nuclear transport factor 2 family protein [Dryocola boscaweniae]MCT4718629.1 nuclear transport factor 2 family protein [Dryocola boscaweniae]